jgi:chromosome segregation ATPase
MTQDITQWLAEIKALQQQVVEARQECDRAFATAANWQRLYETEAQQRRAEAQQARQTIAALRQQIEQFQQNTTAKLDLPAQQAALQAEVAQLQTVPALQAKLMALLLERDRLLQALEQEQANHTLTRRNLTTALGDAIDLLAQETREWGSGE